MSYRYGQFGDGFNLARLAPAAMRFHEAVETRGRPITIVTLTEAGEDSYGQPVYTEEGHEGRAFLDARSSERVLPTGEVKEARVRAYMAAWAPVGEEEYEAEVDGVRYHIAGITETGVNLVLELERKAA